jgi:replicative DNA helicase
MGKTGFAVACADRALKNGVGVALYSLEMSAGQLADRFLAHDGRVQMPPKSDEDWQLVARAAGRLQDRPLYIDDEPSLCPVALRQRLRRLTHEEDVGLVIVDYLQLLKTPRGSDASSRNESVGAITRELKLTAKELDLPILALAQLNRNVESRNPPRPALSDLRDSGEIEEHSDNVLMLYRPEYYGITNDDYGSTDGVGEIIVSKHRNGPTGTVRAAFVEKYAAWMELENHRSNGQPAYSNEPF